MVLLFEIEEEEEEEEEDEEEEEWKNAFLLCAFVLQSAFEEQGLPCLSELGCGVPEYSQLMGMFERNNASLVVANPVESYFSYVVPPVPIACHAPFPPSRLPSSCSMRVFFFTLWKLYVTTMCRYIFDSLPEGEERLAATRVLQPLHDFFGVFPSFCVLVGWLVWAESCGVMTLVSCTDEEFDIPCEGTGLFAFQLLLNHSCEPNCYLHKRDEDIDGRVCVPHHDQFHSDSFLWRCFRP